MNRRSLVWCIDEDSHVVAVLSFLALESGTIAATIPKRPKAFALCGAALLVAFLIRWVTVVAGETHEVRVGLVVDHEKLADGKASFERFVKQIQSQNIAKEYSFSVLTDDRRGCGVDREQGDGAFVAANLYFKQKITSLFGPMCHSDLEITGRLSNQWNIIQFNFWRDHRMDIDLQTVVQMSTSSAVNFAVNLAALLNALNWNKVALFTCGKCFDDEDLAANRYQIVNRVLNTKGMQIVLNRDLTTDEVEQPHVLADILNQTKLQMRIMVPFFGRDLTHYRSFVEAVKISKLDPEQYVTILTVFYDKVNVTLPWLDGDQVDEKVKANFDRSIVMVNEYYNSAEAAQFIRSLSAQDPFNAQGYLQLYESIFVDLTMLEKAANASGEAEIFRNGSFVRSMMRNVQMRGPFGPIYLDGNTQRLSPFAVYYVEPQETRPVPFVSIAVTVQDPHSGEPSMNLVDSDTNTNVSLMADIPPDMPTCGFNNELCDQSGTIIVIASVMALVVAAIIMFIIFRKMYVHRSCF
uniref:ANF_receptor domain-containing protein n=1 Tax=Steinernema glaseri TaxID=37863 RepID=A0A1I7ZF63_9BILA